MSESIGKEWIQSTEKRAMDMVVATAMAPVALPLSMAAIASIGAVDRVNPLFFQERVGKNLETFVIPKIRTMPGVKENTPLPPGTDREAKASKIGRLLRKTHIDELPQGFMIISGKMAVVGPRPLVLSEFEMIREGLAPSERKSWLEARQICRPGVVFPYNTKQHMSHKEPLDFHKRAEADIEYAQNASRSGDFKIIAKSFLFSKADLLHLDIEDRPGHPQTLAVFSNIAKSFGVHLNEADFAYWRAMLNASKVLDTAVDTAQEKDISGHIEQLIAGEQIEGISQQEAQEFSDAFSALPTERKKTVRQGAQLAEFAETQRQITNPKEFVESRLEEAELFVAIMSLNVDEKVSDSGGRARFNRWLITFGRAGYLLDSLIDQTDDYEKNEIALKPIAYNRIFIARRALSELRACINGMPKTDIPNLAGATASKALRNYTRTL